MFIIDNIIKYIDTEDVRARAATATISIPRRVHRPRIYCRRNNNNNNTNNNNNVIVPPTRRVQRRECIIRRHAIRSPSTGCPKPNVTVKNLHGKMHKCFYLRKTRNRSFSPSAYGVEHGASVCVGSGISPIDLRSYFLNVD